MLLKGRGQTQSTEWPSANTLSLNSLVLSQYFAVVFGLASDLHSFDAWMALFLQIVGMGSYQRSFPLV